MTELKTAVYLKKKAEDGIVIASKDLADVVALNQNNPSAITDELIDSMHPEIWPEVKRIRGKVQRTRT